MKHEYINIVADSGLEVRAQAPVIVSASRATDIPAFYADWFFERLERGYVRWRNPFNGVDSYVSFANTRFIVFWSKNPEPLLTHLPKLREKGIGCYVQYTLNDYEREGLEPNVPSLSNRIDTFRRLVDVLGKGVVVWRFDPLILTDIISIDGLIAKISNIAEQLKGYTEKLVLLSTLNSEHWNFELATCAEVIDLTEYGIGHNRCIDPDLIARLSPDDPVLQNYLWGVHSDKGQRRACGCILSKDIGAYNTCPHSCLYCYANTSPQSALINYNKHKV